MFTRITLSTLCLWAGVVIGISAPSLARSDAALYSASIHLRMFERPIPYGVSLTGPGLRNSPFNDLASVYGSSPASFTLPPGQIALSTSATAFSPYSTLDYRITKFLGENDVGTFFPGGGNGSSTYGPTTSIAPGQFGVSFSGGPNRFGGVMRLLGSFDWRGELANCSGCTYHTLIPLSGIGGSFGGTATASTYLGGTASLFTFVKATVWGFPWDTGTVSAVANVLSTSSPTTTTAMGSDLRTASGLGTLQLVTPFLVRVTSTPSGCPACASRYYYAGIASAEIHFVPEPSANAILAAGMGTLAVLYRRSNRRRG